jgi:hypothetical protein
VSDSVFDKIEFDDYSITDIFGVNGFTVARISNIYSADSNGMVFIPVLMKIGQMVVKLQHRSCTSHQRS